MAMLEVNNLSIQFGGLHAVDNFQLKIEKGELYGLIGPNGAGKTTVFNLMNPNETQELMDTIRFVRDHFNMTILLIEHDMKLVGGICEELTVLNFGQVLCQGETAKVLKDPAVVTAYLGE